jgi:hypothetical protein
LADAHNGGADSLRKHLSDQLRSGATTSYSDARQRLPLAFLLEALTCQARRILALNPKATWRGFLVSLLDGTTVRLRPYGDIPKTFPPHRNQAKTQPYWCLLRAVVCFCAHTGAALACALGPLALSEQVLACQIILQQSFAPCLFIGDRNFGIFQIAQTVRQTKGHALLRLTEMRARKLLGHSLRVGDYSVCWTPTPSTQLQPGCDTLPVEGRLLVVRIKRKGFRALTLYLFTTLKDNIQYPLEELVKLYGVRWHIELNLRYLKDQMRLAQLECKSADMAQKEWFAGLMAYNLIRAAMLCAALQKALSPLDLSFCASRRYVEIWLGEFYHKSRGSNHLWEQMLRMIQKARRPKRKRCRPAEPRAQRHLRQSFPPLIGSRSKARRLLQKYAQKS